MFVFAFASAILCTCVLSPFAISFFPHPLHFLSDPLVIRLSSLSLLSAYPNSSISLCVVVHFAINIYSILCCLYMYKIHTVRYLSWEIVCECKIRYPIIRKWFFEWKSTRIWQCVSCKSAQPVRKSRCIRTLVCVRVCVCIKGRKVIASRTHRYRHTMASSKWIRKTE